MAPASIQSDFSRRFAGGEKKSSSMEVVFFLGFFPVLYFVDDL